MFKKEFYFKKNSSRLLNICSELIDKYQSHTLKPSCKEDLLKHVKDEIIRAKEEVSGWKDYDTDYIKIAHSLLTHGTFNLLSSGKYHIHYGELNPLKCVDNLMDVYKASMHWAVENNLVDDTTRSEQYQYLLNRISQVG